VRWFNEVVGELKKKGLYIDLRCSGQRGGEDKDKILRTIEKKSNNYGSAPTRRRTKQKASYHQKNRKNTQKGEERGGGK